MRVISDPRTLRVAAVSVVAWLVLGWAWGDDWLWSAGRAIGLTAFCIATVAVYAERHPLARVGRVAVGTAVGGFCANSLGGGGQAVLITAAALMAVLLGCEYLIGREVRAMPSAR